jgi:hypothetical protein
LDAREPFAGNHGRPAQAIHSRRVFAHIFHRGALFCDRLAFKLGIFQFLVEHLARFQTPRHIADGVGEPILAAFQFARDEMEAVDEAPCEFGCEGVEAGVGQQVEDGGDDAAAFRLRRDRIGHEMFGGFLARLDDGEGQGSPNDATKSGVAVSSA